MRRCYERAKDMINSLPDKWNPTTPKPEDFEKEDTRWQIVSEEDAEPFDPRITTKGSLADAFRIFTGGECCNDIPDTRLYPDNDTPTLHVYTDGSCTHNGLPKAKAGSGIFVGDNDPRNRAIKIPQELGPSNQVGEIIAVKEVARELGPDDIVVYSDSKFVVDGLSKHIKKWEDRGYIGTANTPHIQSTIAALRRRKAKTAFKWFKGHAGIEGNERADKLADEGRQKSNPDPIDMSIPPEFRVPGAKLKEITQSLAYKGIRLKKQTSKREQEARDRKKTRKHMRKAQKAAKKNTGKETSQKQIWKSTRHKDISRNIRQFLFMLMHGGYKVGKFWKNVPNYDHRTVCTHCGRPESIRHILLECEVPGRKTVWTLAEEIWKKKGLPWPTLGLGTILSCGFTTFGTEERPDVGASRFYRILMSESAYLIWKMRNQRVINGEQPLSLTQIKNKWVYTLKLRYKTDLLLTNTRKYEKQALPKSLVRSTWHKIMEERDDLPQAELMVGRLGV
ncbi:hypothetical protein AAF712_013253 [Marasmius tenuissimus]|uniref:ribonuclease H n=1 Tax=Marasmius tenuissimus TaxID=585030 RepID=A0ABR2ZE65_9AGAR